MENKMVPLKDNDRVKILFTKIKVNYVKFKSKFDKESKYIFYSSSKRLLIFIVCNGSNSLYL